MQIRSTILPHTCQNDLSKRQEIIRVGENVEKRSPRALLVECKLVLPAWETVQFPQEIKNRTYDAEVTLQSASPKETK